jgi:hypothetical protein
VNEAICIRSVQRMKDNWVDIQGANCFETFNLANIIICFYNVTQLKSLKRKVIFLFRATYGEIILTTWKLNFVPFPFFFSTKIK